MRTDTGHTFGGYASAPWNSGTSYTNAAGCFLFLVENPHGDTPTCFECKVNGQALCGNPGFGPLFGSDDIHLTSDGRSSYAGFPASYTDTLGRGKHATFAGAYNFTAEDYEVWAAAT